ncbi:MAG: prolipoprotein diacylglyceryl transferase [Anaerolineae bacterium]|nr:prolipoprotein diacylglyceryl transferase [Anaerolineae bacterium]
MIDPVLFSFKLFALQITLTWYGLIVMTGVLVGGWIAEREVRRRGENGEVLLDAMVWAVIAGIIGARLWYVVNAIIGGNRIYIEDPMAIIRPPIAGLHFFGGLLLGALVLALYLRREGYDVWLFMDAVAPAALLGQAIGRLGNFVNLELYGPPTTLPWGIVIPLDHRLPEFANLSETTRFHPTFFYEMVLNVLAFLFIIWYSRRNDENEVAEKPGTIFSLWLISAGFIRVFIEFFRPDQPKLGDTFITTSMLVAFLMGVAGVVMYLALKGKLQLAFAENWPEEYRIKKVEKKPASLRTRKVEADPIPDDAEDEIEKPVVKRKAATRAKPVAKATTTKKAPVRKKKTSE